MLFQIFYIQIISTIKNITTVYQVFAHIERKKKLGRQVLGILKYRLYSYLTTVT